MSIVHKTQAMNVSAGVNATRVARPPLKIFREPKADGLRSSSRSFWKRSMILLAACRSYRPMRFGTSLANLIGVSIREWEA